VHTVKLSLYFRILYSVLDVWRNNPVLAQLRQEAGESCRQCHRCELYKKKCLGTCLMMRKYAELTSQPDPYCKLSLARHEEMTAHFRS